MSNFFLDLKCFFTTPPWSKDRDAINRAAMACPSVIALCAITIGLCTAIILVRAIYNHMEWP